jgi:predicted secreted protein
MSQSQAVLITKGQSVQVERPANLTTGYTWDILLSPGLLLESEVHNPSAAARQGAIGAGGTQIWQIKTIQEGIQYIILWNHRRWEQDTLENTEVIKLQVSK